MADKPNLEMDEVLASLVDEKHTETLVEEPNVETTEEVVEEKPKRTRKTSKEKTAKEMLSEKKNKEELCVCETQSRTWKEVFIANYEGKS